MNESKNKGLIENFKGAGYVIALISTILYLFLTEQLEADLSALLGSLLGAALIPVCICALIWIIKDNFNFEKSIAIVVPLFQLIAYIGENYP